MAYRCNLALYSNNKNIQKSVLNNCKILVTISLIWNNEYNEILDSYLTSSCFFLRFSSASDACPLPIKTMNIYVLSQSPVKSDKKPPFALAFYFASHRDYDQIRQHWCVGLTNYSVGLFNWMKWRLAPVSNFGELIQVEDLLVTRCVVYPQSYCLSGTGK